jgi:mutator protein MutT
VEIISTRRSPGRHEGPNAGEDSLKITGPPTILVVAAVIIRDGRVLMTQRLEEAHLPLHWEFPGGKVEEGESPPAALERELMEELGIQTEIEEPFAFNWHDYGEKRILLLTYLARILQGDPKPLG